VLGAFVIVVATTIALPRPQLSLLPLLPLLVFPLLLGLSLLALLLGRVSRLLLPLAAL
jgi:hypothetical protein